MNPQHEKAQCRRLIAVVRELAHELDRPICTRDLMAYYVRCPDKRPVLWQALGQQLIKATRPAPAVDRLHRIGLIGNHAYYAADARDDWADKFARYHAETVLGPMLQENLPAIAESLLDGPCEELARNAMAGWCLEAKRLLPRVRDPKLIKSTALMMRRAKEAAAPSFAAIPLTDLVPRAVALAILRDEIKRRAAYRLESGINWDRFLAWKSWPQSPLFHRAPGSLLYSERQMTLLAKTLWPEANENPNLARTEFLALRFGLPG